MKSIRLSKEIVENLHKIIGGQIMSIFVERGRIAKAENMILDGEGMISIVVAKNNINYKWRLKFHHEVNDKFYSEFYEWQQPTDFKDRYNPRTGVVNYDKDGGEDFKKFHLSFEVAPKENEDYNLANQIKSIKIYHDVGEFENGNKYDYLAFIDIETATGRRVIIEEDDPIHSFYIYFDDLNTLNYRLAEIHDEDGKYLGKKRYQLRHEIS